MQVEREFAWLYQYAGARIVSCVGGMDSRTERRKLAEGAHIVIGTPGRLRDHIERRGLIVDELKAVVLDEADEMLDLGFREDLEFILEATPAARRTLLFSATMPKGIAALAKRYQHNALRIEVAGGGARSRGYRISCDQGSLRMRPNMRSSICCASSRRKARSYFATRANPSGTCTRHCSNAASPPCCCRAN